MKDDNIEIVCCDPKCEGKNDLCLFRIAQIIKSGKIAFMIYSVHIEEKIKKMGYNSSISRQGDIPVGLYIYKGQ